MAVVNGSNSTQQPHVPAWKRLGLKLKYANDTAEPAPTQQQPSYSTSAPVANSRSAFATAYQKGNEPPLKKRKTSSESDPSSQQDAQPLPSGRSSQRRLSQRENLADDSEPAARPSIEAEPVTASQDSTLASSNWNFEDYAPSTCQHPSTSKRSKSVTFTGETKQNDGNSAHSLASPEHGSATLQATPPTTEAISSEKARPKKPKKSKKEPSSRSGKGESTSNKGKPSKDEPQTTEKPEYVRYLEQFQEDKASWKFNKNHQTALLKNLFNFQAVPASLTPALAEYVSGLRGAGPRERLIESATAILRKFADKDGSLDEIDAMNTESARREAYIRALWRELKKWEDAGMSRSEYDDNTLEDIKEEEERGRRAEAVLRALPLSEIQSQPATSSTQAPSIENSQRSDSIEKDSSTPNTTITSTSGSKNSQRRKRRVDVSSDSSDSDSSSDDRDEDPSAPIKGPTTVTAALKPTPAYMAKPQPVSARTPAYQHDNLNMSYRPQNPSQLMSATAKPTRKIFDDDLLDQVFPKPKTYNETAPKRRKKDGQAKAKARGLAYTHGTRADESGSEDED